MEKNKRIAIAAISLCAATAIITTSVLAIFSSSDKSAAEAKAGGVQLAPINITVGNAFVLKNVDSEFISTYDYCNSTAIDGPSAYGPWADQGIGFSPRWRYTTAEQMVETSYFRTSDGEVAYCMDLGKLGPSSGVSDEATSVSDVANRILAAGYPNKTAADYQDEFPGLTDIQLEWATQVALKISEGTAFIFDENDEIYQDDSMAMKLDQFSMNLNDSARFHPTWQSQAKLDDAQMLYNLIVKLVSAGKDSTKKTDRFEMSVDNVKNKKVKGGYLIGPYDVKSTFSDPVTLTADVAGTVFRNPDGKDISSITGDGQFYVFVPDSATEQVNIQAGINGKTMPASYYYWTGEEDEQKMLVSKTIPVKAESVITTTYDDKLSNWNPGDITTFKWEVENTSNKSADTRNTIYMYWDDADITQSPVYLYTESTSNADITKDILNDSPVANMDMGVLKTFTINGESKTGYMLTIEGDTLDGVGEAAETGDSKEVDYSSSYDDSEKTKDILAFKAALSPNASYESMKKNFKIVVVTEAKQYHNTKDTDDNGWAVVDTAEVIF